jgi:DNA helicase-2/ATP-dependent DNA helicase PcrA
MNKLITWRIGQAQQEQLAPFLIFTDVTLKAIAEVGDLSQAMRIGVAGITEEKVQKYQADFAELFAK